MTPASLAAALRACAVGLYPLEAGVGLLIANGTFLHRDDFTSRFILHGTSTAEDAQMAAVDWDAAAAALAAGELSLLKRRTADPETGGQPRRRHPRRPERRRHRSRSAQHPATGNRHPPRIRSTPSQRNRSPLK